MKNEDSHYHNDTNLISAGIYEYIPLCAAICVLILLIYVVIVYILFWWGFYNIFENFSNFFYFFCIQYKDDLYFLSFHIIYIFEISHVFG